MYWLERFFSLLSFYMTFCKLWLKDNNKNFNESGYPVVCMKFHRETSGCLKLKWCESICWIHNAKNVTMYLTNTFHCLKTDVKSSCHWQCLEPHCMVLLQATKYIKELISKSQSLHWFCQKLSYVWVLTGHESHAQHTMCGDTSIAA